MKILAIETSCDETAVSVIESTGIFPHATYRILGNALFSQIDIHREYGGVFPSVAKREHAKTLVPMLKRALDSANLEVSDADPHVLTMRSDIAELLSREGDLANDLIMFSEIVGVPDIDAIAVTEGPGLEPALWVGVNFAKALSLIWKKPLVGINHMEGHIISSLYEDDHLREVVFPALALLISGGHTELVLMRTWGMYELIGKTRDDAIGEAFDKVARLLGLPYPGGPEISKLAKRAREERIPHGVKLPRPMLKFDDFDFSFSGLKTAVRYAVQDKSLAEDERLDIAREFEDAAGEVLISKTLRALDETGSKSLIVGGGVSANTYIRETFEKALVSRTDCKLFFPEQTLATDNAIMIALAAHAKLSTTQEPYANPESLRASGNLSLHTKN